ncbi:uncharacterized protein LOC110917640 [Helianthus annuus]|uniref:uncharacterized protein LOC110917640 n=1 Tax=Helianthus annuus TaxID=4232 RepID=UPI000B8F1C5D|nr:uncharacterized protein LOC110917640 [Helianthus annuus]
MPISLSPKAPFTTSSAPVPLPSPATTPAELTTYAVKPWGVCLDLIKPWGSLSLIVSPSKFWGVLLRSDKTLVAVAAVSSATVTVSSATVQHHLSGHSFAALLGFFGGFLLHKVSMFCIW